MHLQIFAKMPGNLDEIIFATLHHDYKRYITIEIFCDRIFAMSNIRKNSVANKFQSTVPIIDYILSVIYSTLIN